MSSDAPDQPIDPPASFRPSAHREPPPTDDAAAAPVPARRIDATLLEGNIRSTVMRLALPAFGEQMLNAGVAWNDMFMAGRISTIATNSVGAAAYVDWLVTMLFMLVGTAATAMVARAIGAGLRRDAEHTLGQAMLFAVVLGLFGAAGVLLTAPALVGWFNLAPATAASAAAYIRIGALGYFAEAVTFVGAAALRGAGDTRTPMFVLGIVNVLNIGASWLLAFPLGLGARGIVIGTLLARLTGGLLMLEVLVRGRSVLQLRLSQMRPDRAVLTKVLRIGGPASADGWLMWMGHFAFLRNVSLAGGGFQSDTLLAAHMVGVRIESLSYLPATAWGMAAATLVGQNLGAGLPDRARRCAHEAAKQAAVLLCCMGLTYVLAAPYFFRFLTHDAEVIRAGVPALRALALSQPGLGLLIVYLWSLRGAGDTLFPMIFTVIGVLAVRYPISYLGGPVWQGALIGAWCGMYVDINVRAVLMLLRFRGKAWARVRV